MRLLLLSLLIIYCSQAIGQEEQRQYALPFVHVVDVENKTTLKNQTIVVKEDRIIGVYPSKEFNIPDSLPTFDFTDHFVIPGLIDAHVHLGTNPSGGDNLEKSKERLAHLLQNGITGVRDMAGDARHLSFLARQTSLDEIMGPDIFYSALIAGPTFFKDPRTQAAAKGMLPGTAPWMRAVSPDSDLAQLVAEAKGTGATGIKVYANLEAEILNALVDHAHRQELKVWSHATVFPARPSEVCSSGADVLSHSTYLAWEGQSFIPDDAIHRHNKHENFDPNDAVFRELMQCMAQYESILDATIATYGNYFPDSTLYNYGTSLTRLAYKTGVKIGVGTDMGFSEPNTPAVLFREMEILQNEVGMEPIEVLESATLINAEMIGKEDEIGSIKVGKKANLVILVEDPNEDVSHLKKPVLVIKNGRHLQPK